MTAKRPKAKKKVVKQLPGIRITQEQLDAMIGARVKDAIEEQECFYCADDRSHSPLSNEKGFLALHEEHDFVRFRVFDPVENDVRAKTLRVNKKVEEGDYNVKLALDGTVYFEKDALPLRGKVQLRVTKAAAWTT